MKRRLPLKACLALLLVPIAAGCGADPARQPSTAFQVRASVGQVHIWGAAPGTPMELIGPGGQVAAFGTSDYQGSLILRDVAPGEDYAVRLAGDPGEWTGGLRVMSVEGSLPDEAFYAGQVLAEGYQYLTMRDGTHLSAFVWLPGPPEDGPYPTVVNYSGYGPSRPGRSLGPEVEPLCGVFPVLCNAPNHPSGLLAGMKGYASVGVNMRGTGCSGGAYDYFEPLQLLDGYDIIEIVSRQRWVLHNHVGMAGLSYPGISQLFVARTRPPGLAAITPMSVIADTSSSCLAPGGIYNNGFALAWIENVLDRAEPYGQSWIRDLVDAGDALCEENQLLHSQKLDAVSKALENPFYTDEVAGELDPSRFADQIDVPVYLSGQWQDEQTGPHFAVLFDRFGSAPVVRFLATNGVHADGFAAQMLMEWMIFLDLYVARQVPRIDDTLRTLAPTFFQQLYGASLHLPENRFEGYDDYQQARAAFEAEDPLRVIFETGVLPGSEAGAPQGTFQESFAAWPIPGTLARRWYFQPDGSLGDEPPGPDGGACRFEHDPEAGQRITLAPGSSVDDPQPDYTYRQLVEGKAVAFQSTPLQETLVLIGSGSVDLWLQSTAEDADLEVNLTEIRPDGQEQLVQSGWLRASQRALREAEATELRPVKTHYEQDARPLVAGQWSLVRVEIMPFAHIFRAGSRIRISVDTPGDSRAWWKFILLDHGATRPLHNIAHHREHPSSVVLPVVPGIEVSTDLPPCRSLRGQPCREYSPLSNPPSDLRR